MDTYQTVHIVYIPHSPELIIVKYIDSNHKSVQADLHMNIPQTAIKHEAVNSLLFVEKQWFSTITMICSSFRLSRHM